MLPKTASAQGAPPRANPAKVVRVVRVESPPTIDGRLDEAVWELADVITDFHQIRPGDGAEPSDPTEVYLLYDDDAPISELECTTANRSGLQHPP